MTGNTKTKPAALLLLGTHCPHCPQVLKALSELVKAGDIHKLEVVNVEQAPEIARELGVRGVPWIRVGEFTLTGMSISKMVGKMMAVYLKTFLIWLKLIISMRWVHWVMMIQEKELKLL